MRPLPKSSTIELDLFLDDDVVSIIGAKKGHEEKLQNSIVDYQ